jgi:type II secretion system protein N
VTPKGAARNGVERLLNRARAIVGGLTPGLERVATAERRPLVWYGLYTLVLFVLCFLATLPHDLLLQRALHSATANTPFRIETEGGSLGWTLSYALDSLRVRMRARDAEAEPLLLAEALRFSPSCLGLLRGSPYPLGIGASLYGGTLHGTVDPRAASFRVDATLDGVDLARYTGLRPLVDGTVRGRLEAAVALDGAGRGPAAATGSVTLRLPGLALEGTKVGGITIPDLHFSDVHLNGAAKNGRLEISEFVANGEEIVVRGDGNVLLRYPLDSSIMSLDLVVAPAADAPDGLRLAVSMLPGTSAEGGARRIGIVGTIGRPTMR